MRAVWIAILTAICASLSPISASGQTLFEAHYAPVNGGAAQTSARLIAGILSYTRWPTGQSPSQPQVICVVGVPRFSGPLPSVIAGGGRTARTQLLTALDVVSSEECDTLFLGKMPVADRQRLIAWVRAKPVLTITDDDPNCSYGSMFCLVHRGQTINFTVNIDAVSRSQMRIDPRVLRIGKEGAL